MAAIGLACSASTSRADITKMLQFGETGKAGTPRLVLPAISNPRPFRQGLYVPCTSNQPPLGANGCLMEFDVVPAGRLAQIDNVHCLAPGGGVAIIFNNKVKVSAANLVGFVQPPLAGSSGGTASGPFYFRAGERPVLFSSGTAPTENAFCSIYGTLWQTN